MRVGVAVVRRERLATLMRTFVERGIAVIGELFFAGIGLPSLLLRRAAGEIAAGLIAAAAPAALTVSWGTAVALVLGVGMVLVLSAAGLWRGRSLSRRRRREGTRSRGHIGRTVGIGLIGIGHRRVSVCRMGRALKRIGRRRFGMCAKVRVGGASRRGKIGHES